ncbi:MAG: ATP-binding cassette domain-containing protein [Candidatus Bathyarchaeota archaeon]|jgi:peptide/nickel transport system ATP-binding protein|nr:ATP-binding cassette domain-containing protein [Candidatus Bathyarchaeota archaeon]
MSQDKIIEVTDLKKWFPVRKGFIKTLLSRKESFVRAVDGINFNVKPKEVFGLVGESGSGKTTTGRLVVKMINPTSGRIFFKGVDITDLTGKQMKQLRRKMQMVFQDPYESLNPRKTVMDIVAEGLRIQKIVNSEKEVEEKVIKALEDVKLVPPEEFLLRYPHELSGGQRQRVAIARTFIVNPEFVVSDEPVSMLDVSIRAEILNLFIELIEKFNVSILYITHDLATARHMCHRIAVMYLGKIMEMGSAEDIVYEPLHPYTTALISAVPVPDPKSRRTKSTIKGEIPSPIDPPPGCRFCTRCPAVEEICKKEEPELINVGKEHYVACHKIK